MNLDIHSEVRETENFVRIGDYEFHDISTVMMTENRRTIHETIILAIRFHSDIVNGYKPVGPYFGESAYCLNAFYRPQ